MIRNIETDRLLLRKLTLADTEDLFEYASNPIVAQYISWNALKSIDQAERYIKKVMSEYENGENPYVWAIEYKENNKMIGTIEISILSKKHRRCELESDMNPDYWGKGLNTEALKAVIHFIFTNLNINKIAAVCYEENIGSSRVLEKVGMKYDGKQRQHFYTDNRFHDILLYSVLREEYFNKHIRERNFPFMF